MGRTSMRFFHEGACSDTMEYDVNYMMKENYAYSKALLHFAMGARIPFFYASSASTYGAGKMDLRRGDAARMHSIPMRSQSSRLTAMYDR